MSRHSAQKHHAYATSFTRTGKLNMQNRKPFRTAAQKYQARATARLVDGAWVSGAPVSFHSAPRRREAA